jgi:hypothetical protein
MNERPRHEELFYVYVVALRPKATSMRSSHHEVYVGSSALTPEVRFHKHKTEPKASRHVRRRGIRLLPHLYAHLNPLHSRAEAKAAEKRLANHLEAKGYHVYGSCSPRTSPTCWL